MLAKPFGLRKVHALYNLLVWLKLIPPFLNIPTVSVSWTYSTDHAGIVTL